MQHQGVLTKQQRENSLGLRADDTPPGSFDSPSPRGSGSLRMTGESKDQRDPIPRPNRKGGWKFRISVVRPRDLLRPGVLKPPTEIVSIFGSRLAAAEPIPHRLRLASSTSGVRDECVAGEKAKHEQIKGYTNSGIALVLTSNLDPNSQMSR